MVTTATLWVCSCGRVDRVDGGVSMAVHEVCPVRVTLTDHRHIFKTVLVVVPIP